MTLAFHKSSLKAAYFGYSADTWCCDSGPQAFDTLVEDEEKQAMKEQQEQDKEIQQIEQSYDAGEDNFVSVSYWHFLD